MKFYLSRQNYWPDGDLVVEIAKGGLDYANADMLSDQGTPYAKMGCGQEYADPREALKAAIAIRDEWLVLSSRSDIRVETGYTGGYTMPFQAFPDDEDLAMWAQREWDAIEKCARCGEPIVEAWHHHFDPETLYCSDNCVSIAWEQEDEWEEDEG